MSDIKVDWQKRINRIADSITSDPSTQSIFVKSFSRRDTDGAYRNMAICDVHQYILKAARLFGHRSLTENSGVATLALGFAICDGWQFGDMGHSFITPTLPFLQELHILN